MKTLHGYPLVDDDFESTHPDHGKGYAGRDYSQFPLNGADFCAEPSITRLSEKEIVERVQYKNDKKDWIVDLGDRAGVVPKNQKNSSYCWIHAPTHGMELARAAASGVKEPLSAFRGAWPIKHGSNQGGSGIEGVHGLAKGGTCTEALWPSMQFKPPGGKPSPEVEANAALHKITLYAEIPRDDHQLIFSYLVQNYGVTVGIPAWGHEVLLVALVFQGGTDFGSLREKFRNSWGNWGVNGCGVLDGAKRKFDEAGAIESMAQSKT